ncbi:MAG TPA: glycine cleavage system H protein [Chlamydiales bacterium]|nr:glycine cleavage system H protein [Chlamydiales bacterium]
MRYTESHEWISEDGTVGITEYAKNELGDIVFIELPKIGTEVKAGQQVCVLESTKAAVDVYSPASGKVIAVNMDLVGTPAKIKEKDVWLFKLKLSNPKEVESLLDEQGYSKLHK